jgi:predicted nucleic acid-binding protein
MGPVRRGHLLDSDVLIYHLNAQLDERGEIFLADVFQGSVYISVISRMEILGWRGHTDDSWTKTSEWLKALQEVALDEEVVQTTIRIRRNADIKLPDAIIAASAVTRHLPLITRNVKHFNRITGLTIVNPFEC